MIQRECLTINKKGAHENLNELSKPTIIGSWSANIFFLLRMNPEAQKNAIKIWTIVEKCNRKDKQSQTIFIGCCSSFNTTQAERKINVSFLLRFKHFWVVEKLPNWNAKYVISMITFFILFCAMWRRRRMEHSNSKTILQKLYLQ